MDQERAQWRGEGRNVPQLFRSMVNYIRSNMTRIPPGRGIAALPEMKGSHYHLEMVIKLSGEILD